MVSMKLTIPAAAARSGLAAYLRAWVDYGRARAQLRREREQLLALSDRELRDIGITRVDALREASEKLRFRR